MGTLSQNMATFTLASAPIQKGTLSPIQKGYTTVCTCVLDAEYIFPNPKGERQWLALDNMVQFATSPFGKNVTIGQKERKVCIAQNLSVCQKP